MAIATKRRIEYIDLLRGWAVIVMIQTHVFNATLTGEITGSGFFEVIKFIDGLVAPSFLFASGLAYAVTTRRKIADYLSFGRPLFKQLWRLLLILLIGYTLHIPKFSYFHLRWVAGERAWQVFFQVDVLHCIAVSLLFLQILLLILRRENRLYTTLVGIVCAVLFATPVMWGIDFWTVMPVPVAEYMNGLHNSLFPLFPWSVFLFAGSITGWLYLKAKDREGHGETKAVPSFMRSAAVFGAVLVVASFVLRPVESAVYPTYDYWRFSPSFVLLRIGLVLLLCAAMFAFERLKGVSPASVVTLIGRESLIVYVAHLTIVYGNFGRFNFHDRVGNAFGYPEALLATLILMAMMYMLARVWSTIKTGPPGRKKGVQIAFALVLVGIFFTQPPT